MTDVFISYCRRDKAFVRALCHALQTNGHQLWVDWDGIQASEPWREEISKGVRNAKRMVYILSPDTIASPYCDWEVDQAFDLQKKLIPILCRDVDISTVREDVSALQFISFCGEDDFPSALAKLEGAITADLEYDHTFAKLAQRAKEWERRNRQDGWLRGAELDDAEVWLSNSTGKTPPPSQIQRDYILASRQERQAELERWQSLYEQSEKRRITAERNEITSFCKSSDAFFALDRPLDALIEALQAGVRVRTADWARDLPELRTQVVSALQQGLYWVRECNRLDGHNGTVWAVSISADGDRIVTASRDTTIRLWTRVGKCLAVLKGHKKLIRTVVFAPNGQWFVSGSGDGTIRMWSREGEAIKVIRDHSDRVLHIAFHPDGSCFASASTDGTVKLWTANGELLANLDFAGVEQRCVAFSTDGKTLASGDQEGQVHLYAVNFNAVNFNAVNFNELEGAGALTPTRTLAMSSHALNTVCFTHDGEWLIAGGVDGWIRAWHRDPPPEGAGHHRQQIYECANPGGEIREIKQMPHRHHLISAGRSGTLDLWTLPDQQQHGQSQKVTTLIGHSGPVLGIDTDVSGTLLLSAGGERVVRLWRWQVPQLVRCVTGGVGSHGVDFNTAADQLLVVGQSKTQPINTLQFWHREGYLLREFAPAAKIWNLCMSHQTDHIATAMQDGTVQLWTTDGTLQAELRGHQDGPCQLCFSADGSLLASASDDGRVCLWDHAGHLLQTLRGEGDRFSCVCFAPDGQSVVAGSRDRTLRHWSLDGTLLNTFMGHGDEVLTVAWRPKGDAIVSGGDDRTVRIWRMDGTLLQTLECQRSVRSVDISPDGSVIAAGCRDGNIRFWSMHGLLLSTLQSRSGQIIRVRFSPDGQYLAATGDKGLLTIWQLDGFDQGLLDRLIDRGVEWCQDYLNHNPNGQTYALSSVD